MSLHSEMCLLLPSLEVWQMVLATDQDQEEFFIPGQWGKLSDCGCSQCCGKQAGISVPGMDGCCSAMCSLIPCESDLPHTRISLGQLLNGISCPWDSCSYKTQPSWKWARSPLGSVIEPFCNSLGTCMAGVCVGLTYITICPDLLELVELRVMWGLVKLDGRIVVWEQKETVLHPSALVHE